ELGGGVPPVRDPPPVPAHLEEALAADVEQFPPLDRVPEPGGGIPPPRDEHPPVRGERQLPGLELVPPEDGARLARVRVEGVDGAVLPGRRQQPAARLPGDGVYPRRQVVPGGDRLAIAPPVVHPHPTGAGGPVRADRKSVALSRLKRQPPQHEVELDRPDEPP